MNQLELEYVKSIWSNEIEYFGVVRLRTYKFKLKN